jgi:hypothetical protein
MAREFLNVRNELSLPCRGCGPADPAPEFDGLAGDFSLEGAKNELWGDGWVENVESWDDGEWRFKMGYEEGETTYRPSSLLMKKTGGIYMRARAVMLCLQGC